MTKPHTTLREWATFVANLPRPQLIERIEELRAERDKARADVRDWKRITNALAKRLPPPPLDVPPPKLVPPADGAA